MAAAIAALYPEAARAALFYGSCLRTPGGALEAGMLDLYLIVSSYRAAYGRGWKAVANRLLPPNVFPFVHGGLAAKYAVLSEADLARLCRPEADNVSVWARFAQPARLAWCADEIARNATVGAIGETGPTLFELTLPVFELDVDHSIMEIWRRGFALTYAAELRAERGDRSDSIVDSDFDRFRRFGEAALAELGNRRVMPLNEESVRRRWRRLQRRGKLLTLARLAKATTTFAGGIDYLAWKINRHAGTEIRIRPWQRRVPVIGALTLLPRLLRSGAVK